VPSRIVTNTRSFYGKEDKTLLNRLLPELPGILLWAIAGWQRLQARGRFHQPESGGELVAEMEDLASPVARSSGSNARSAQDWRSELMNCLPRGSPGATKPDAKNPAISKTLGETYGQFSPPSKPGKPAETLMPSGFMAEST